MKIYRGSPEPQLRVTVEDSATREQQALPLYTNVRNHSPTGFAWGYEGSGPAQLALAILIHAFGDEELALRLYQDFKREIIGKLPMDSDWTIAELSVRDWYNRRGEKALLAAIRNV